MRKIYLVLLLGISVLFCGCASVMKVISAPISTGFKIVEEVGEAVFDIVFPSSRDTHSPSKTYESDKKDYEKEKKEKESARQYLKKGLEAYQSFNYRDTIKFFNKAIDSGYLNTDEKGKSYLFKGASHYLLGEKSQAIQSFKKGKELGATADPYIFTPEMIEIFQQALKKDIQNFCISSLIYSEDATSSKGVEYGK